MLGRARASSAHQPLAALLMFGPISDNVCAVLYTNGHRTRRGPHHIGAGAMAVFPGTGSGFN